MKKMVIVLAMVMAFFGFGINNSEASAHITREWAIEAIQNIDEHYSDRCIRQATLFSDGDEDAELVMLVLLDDFRYAIENTSKVRVANRNGLWQYQITYRVPLVAKEV